ncbi:MAG TPA: class I SAM-dependent methyltransferase, partial [Luteolibacter sp.]|nr:class I SAM-dependent methyltransferase [Luteolibacter sp.]
MKMHRILAEGAAEILKAVFRERRVLDGVLAEAFEENPRWGKRDRNFIASTVFEVVRWRRALAFVADCEEITALCAAQWRRMGYDIPEWWHHRGTTAEDMAEREAKLAEQPRAVRESIPDWLDEVGQRQLGAAWEREISALNRPARVFLRINRLKATREQVIIWLRSHGIEVEGVEGLEDALVLPVGAMLPKELRADGRVEIQDAGSQMIAPMLKVEPGQKIIDACSGAGGKALHLASLMGNQGRIYAMDITAAKLVELERRARRAGASCIQMRQINDDTARDFAGMADGLLIDSPCTGLGTLR